MKDSPATAPPRNVVPSLLRLILGLAICTLALLAALVVLDVLPRAELGAYGVRILLLAGIAVVAVLGVGALLYMGRRTR